MVGVGVVSVVVASVEVVSAVVVIVVSCVVVGHSWAVPVVPGGANTNERAHALGMVAKWTEMECLQGVGFRCTEEKTRIGTTAPWNEVLCKVKQGRLGGRVSPRTSQTHLEWR